MSASAQCPHSLLDFDTHVTFMEDSNVRHVRVSAVCKGCGARMNLGRGLSMGASSRGPSRDTETLGILFPMIPEGEEPTKEYGFFLHASVVTGPSVADD